MSIIETRDLVRDFKRTRAVDHLTLAIEPGESVGYIGANGAGKSTTIKMLTGILKPTSGLVRTCGLDPIATASAWPGASASSSANARSSGGTCPCVTRSGSSPPSTGSSPRSRPRAPTASSSSSRWGRSSARRCDPSRSGSGCALAAAALLHTPELPILDEPTIGLDVLSKQRLREFLVAERRERGTTLLLTTHDMGDVERLCDRVLVVDHGRPAFDGTLPGLAATVGAQRILVIDLAEPTPDLTGVPSTTLVESESGGLRQRLAFDAAATTAAAVLAHVSARHAVRDLAIEEPDIEDVVRRIYAASGRG